MYCPSCGRIMRGPTAPTVPYPIHVCATDGVVYDERRAAWYGLPELTEKVACPGCGGRMEGEPNEPPVRMFFCYQCGITFDRNRASWYGLAYHLPQPR
jgi:hypothetical protein